MPTDKNAMTRQPIQPVEPDDSGVLRFKGNAIVQHLLDFAGPRGCDMNVLATMPFSQEDRRQFAQLIGYSLAGYSDLSYVDDHAYEVAAKLAADPGMSEAAARIEHLEVLVESLRQGLREPMALLFELHPDDLAKQDP